MLREFEKKYKLKLCYPPRNFRTGFQLNWNVSNSIEKSNNALIIISSDEFFKSERCRNVFEQCQKENKKDSAFKLVLILAESEDLISTSKEQAKTASKRQIYLERDDPKLYQKLIKNLTLTKSNKSYMSRKTGRRKARPLYRSR